MGSNLKLFSVLLCLYSFTYTGCNKKSENLESSPIQVSQDDKVAGFWRLKNPDQTTVDGMVVPRLMKLQINRNGARQVDFCGLDRISQGMAGYEIKDSNFVINFYGFQDSTNPKVNEIPTPKIFSGKITRLEADTLELNEDITFIRYTPTQNSALTDNASYLCAF